MIGHHGGVASSGVGEFFRRCGRAATGACLQNIKLRPCGEQLEFYLLFQSIYLNSESWRMTVVVQETPKKGSGKYLTVRTYLFILGELTHFLLFTVAMSSPACTSESV